MFLGSFGIVSGAVGQIFILGAIGYFLVRKGILTREGMNLLSRLVILITLPAMIFSQLIQGFKFSLTPPWWVFPLISFAITFLGLLVGGIFVNLINPVRKSDIDGRTLSNGVKQDEAKRQFLTLIVFQNGGYLPLALVAALLSPEEARLMFIYIFLFLLGFNLMMWSLGVHFLSYERNRRFELGSLFSPPVLATVITMALVGLGVNRFIPEIILKPLRMVGDSTLPLALIVVGGSLGLIRIRRIQLKPVVLLILAKLLILPLLGLVFIWMFPLPRLISLLIIMQLSMPSATTPSLIITHYKRQDLLISQGILLTHLVSLISIPLFLSLVWIR